MARVKRGMMIRARHKKILKMAKGYRGRSSTCFRVAIQKVEKGLRYAYRDRRNKKREFRCLWIQRINAGARMNGTTYARFMHGVKLAGITLNRKMLAEIAATDMATFTGICQAAQSAIESKKAA